MGRVMGPMSAPCWRGHSFPSYPPLRCLTSAQMASALGEPGRLLALVCQPAEVQGCVGIPGHLRFWGVDSGVRHSVGGSDYGSVRVGAFMGLRIASGMESAAQVEWGSGGLLSDT